MAPFIKKKQKKTGNSEAVFAGPYMGGLELTEGPLCLQEEPQLLCHCLRSQIKWNSHLDVAQLERAYQNKKKLTVKGPSTMQTASFCIIHFLAKYQIDIAVFFKELQ